MKALHRKVLAGALLIEAGLLAMHIPARAADAAKIVRMDEEANVPTWFSSSQFLVAALACAALGASDRGRRLAWSGLAAAMLFFSLDEVSELHERVEDRLDFDFALLVLQPLVGLAILVVVWRGLRTLAETPRRFMVAALLAVVLAQGTSILSGDEFPDDAFDYTIQALQEVCEMLAGTFVLVAAIAAGGDKWLQPYREPDG